MAHYKLIKEKLDEFIQKICSGSDVFCIEGENGQLHLVKNEKWNSEKNILGDYRPVEPLKTLLFPPRESIGKIDGENDSKEIKKRVVIGVKNCDLSALKIHDYVFLTSEPEDPYYKELREKTLIVSCDCADAKDVCFCTVVNEQPYPKEGFDINISPVSDGYIIETGSEKGESALNAVAQMLKPADNEILKKRDELRDRLFKKVEEQSAKKGIKRGQDLQSAIQKTEESDFWNEFAKDCVECGACNFSCCTCHCFLLADGLGEEKVPSRIKKWDSCMLLNFARVAGGANPRNHRAERLYNRFDKKFNFFPKILNEYACDGCGRCIEACTGKIDIREVLKRALDEA